MTAVLESTVTIEALDAGAIDAESFDHESHVYAAWLYLERWPLQEAIARFRAALVHLTIKLSAATKYHETVTWFFMLLINQRRVGMGRSTWPGNIFCYLIRSQTAATRTALLSALLCSHEYRRLPASWASLASS